MYARAQSMQAMSNLGILLAITCTQGYFLRVSAGAGVSLFTCCVTKSTLDPSLLAFTTARTLPPQAMSSI